MSIKRNLNGMSFCLYLAHRARRHYGSHWRTVDRYRTSLRLKILARIQLSPPGAMCSLGQRSTTRLMPRFDHFQSEVIRSQVAMWEHRHHHRGRLWQLVQWLSSVRDRRFCLTRMTFLYHVLMVFCFLLVPFCFPAITLFLRSGLFFFGCPSRNDSGFIFSCSILSPYQSVGNRSTTRLVGFRTCMMVGRR